MSDELAVLKIVAMRLDALGIPYMVSGSTAMNYYAQPRMTRDIDIVVQLSASTGTQLADALLPDFYVDRDTVAEAVLRRSMFNAIHSGFIVKVDFIVRKDTPYRRGELSRRRPIDVDGTTIHLAAPEDLVLSKLDWAKDSLSEMQLADARNIVESVPDLDWGYLDRWASTLGLIEMLARVHP